MSKKNSIVLKHKNCFSKSEKILNIYSDFKKKILNLKTNKILVSVSGGPDSLALASMCKALESDYKKTVFIIEALRVCGTKANVLNERIEKLECIDGKTLTFRAFAPIEKVFNLIGDKIKKETRLIFLKGETAMEEVRSSKKAWEKLKMKNNYSVNPNFKTYRSLSAKNSKVVLCTFNSGI